jgi:hypothetical protein
MLQLSAFWPHVGALQAASSLPVVCGWSSPSWVARETELGECPDLQDGELLHPVNYRGCSHAKQELKCRRNLWVTAHGSAWRTVFIEYITPDRTFSAALHSSNQQHPWQPLQQKQWQSSGKNTHHDINQITGQSVQAKNVNSNAAGDWFLVFTMVQQIMTTLWWCDRKGKGCYHN